MKLITAMMVTRDAMVMIDDDGMMRVMELEKRVYGGRRRRR